MLITLIAPLAAAASPTSFRVCGQEGPSLSAHTTTTTLGSLGLRLAEDVSPDASVVLVSAEALSEREVTAAARAAAKGLGHRVRWGRVRSGGEAVADSVAVLVHGRRPVVWPGEQELLLPLAALAEAAGGQGGVRVEEEAIPDNLHLDRLVKEVAPIQAGVLVSMGMLGAELDSLRMWAGSTDALCDALADRLPPMFVIEETEAVQLVLTAPAPIPAMDTLDVLAAIAPGGGLSMQRSDEAVLIQRAAPTPEGGENMMAILVPEGTSFMGLSAPALRSGRGALATLGIYTVPTGSAGAALVMGPSDALDHLAPPPGIEEARQEREAERARRIAEREAELERFVVDGDTIRFPREVVASVIHNGFRSFAPVRDSSGQIQALRLTRRFSQQNVFRGLGLLADDQLQTWNGTPLDGEEALSAMLAGLLEEDAITVTLQRDGAPLTLSWQIEGAPIEAPKPRVVLEMDLAEAQYRSGIAIDGNTMTAPRDVLAGATTAQWGGQFLRDGDAYYWDTDERQTIGLGLLFAPTERLVSHAGRPLTEPEAMRTLLVALMTQESVEVGLQGGESLRIVLRGPPLSLPDDFRLPVRGPGVLSITDRCSNPTADVRFVPHRNSAGEIDGVRLSGIRRNSAFYWLDIKNGDILVAVNGSQGEGDDALHTRLVRELSAALEEPGSHSLELIRRNQHMPLTIVVERGACPQPE